MLAFVGVVAAGGAGAGAAFLAGTFATSVLPVAVGDAPDGPAALRAINGRAGGAGSAPGAPWTPPKRWVAGAVAPSAIGGAFALPTPGSDALIGDGPGDCALVAGFSFT